MSCRANQHGFTLIELVIVIVILGLLAAYSIPKYQAMSWDAKESATKSALGELRTGISSWRSENIVRTGSASWPALDSMNAIGAIMLQSIPPNPYQSSAKAPDSIVLGVTKGVIAGPRGGWAYKPSTGEIWPNTSSFKPGSGCGGTVAVKEYSW